MTQRCGVRAIILSLYSDDDDAIASKLYLIWSVGFFFFLLSLIYSYDYYFCVASVIWKCCLSQPAFI